MLMILAEMVPSYFGGYYADQYRQGKIGLRKFFWLMSSIFMTSLLLFALFFNYQYVLDHWIKFLIVILGSGFAFASFATAMAWLYKRQSTRASREDSVPVVGAEVKQEG